MSQVAPSRSRAPNFTLEDQELLLEVLEPYLHIIECKKTDNIKISQKSEAWSKVTLSYNAKTKNVSRSVDNLTSCYKNMKSKLKKLHSEAKMNIQDPNDKQERVRSLEANSEDWATVAKTINKPVDERRAGCLNSKAEFKKLEILNNNKIMGTGGGPPPDNEENPFKKLKSILEPQVNGLYTVYDGDADLMKDFQDHLPQQEQIIPIDCTAAHDVSENVDEVIAEADVNTIPSTSITPTPLKTKVRPIINRKEIFKRKRDPVMFSSKKIDKATKSCNDSFRCLAEAKLELVNLQMEIVSMEFRHKEKVQELELEEIIKENKFKDELRLMKLKLLDLEIKKMSE